MTKHVDWGDGSLSDVGSIPTGSTIFLKTLSGTSSDSEKLPRRTKVRLGRFSSSSSCGKGFEENDLADEPVGIERESSVHPERVLCERDASKRRSTWG